MTEADQQIDMEIRKMLADQLRKQVCNGLARKIETGFDQNPRTIAAIAVIRGVLGIGPTEVSKDTAPPAASLVD